MDSEEPESIYSDPTFDLPKTELSPKALRNLTLLTGATGGLAGLAPTVFRHFTGQRNTGLRTLAEAGAGTAMGALLPMLLKWKFEYTGPKGRVNSWEDLRNQMYIPQEKRAGLEKQAVLPLLPLAGAAAGWLWKAYLAYSIARGAYDVYGTHRQARAAAQLGHADEAAKLRSSRNWQAALLPLYLVGAKIPGFAALKNKALPHIARFAPRLAKRLATAVPAATAAAPAATNAAAGAVTTAATAAKLPFKQRAANFGKNVAIGTGLTGAQIAAGNHIGNMSNQAYEGISRRTPFQPGEAQAYGMQAAPAYPTAGRPYRYLGDAHHYGNLASYSQPGGAMRQLQHITKGIRGSSGYV
jgi:hypothetical protein